MIELPMSHSPSDWEEQMCSQSVFNLNALPPPAMSEPMSSRPVRKLERIVHKATSFEDAAEWDIRQHLSLSPQERMRAAKVLKDRSFPKNAPDVRACREK
jgi:hypothetical protein